MEHVKACFILGLLSGVFLVRMRQTTIANVATFLVSS